MTEKIKDKPADAQQVETVTLTIDGIETMVPKGTTVLEAAKQLGINIPTFCWHPKLKSVGACRMCYVEIEKMPKLQVSCSTQAMDGMVVHTDSDIVKQGRKAIIEFTLINHPLDCPTCDKGGECDLQDLTFAHGIDDTRFDFMKYRFVTGTEGTTFDDKRIGPEIVLNRNRCILCFKCVRANKEAFGEFDLGAYERGNITEINAAPGQQVDNPFSGNLVEICPVGALTNTDWRYKIRVWLTKQSSSISPFTGSGENIIFFKEDHRNRIFRVTSRRNDDIDDGWLADVVRYGYRMIHAEDRIKKPLIRKEGRQVEATWDEAIDHIVRHLSGIKDEKGGVCIGGLASPDLDNATLLGFSKLMRMVFGSNNIDYRYDYRRLPNTPEGSFSVLASRPFRIADIDDSDVIVTVGTDLLKEHHNLYVRTRKAHNFDRARVFVINPYATKQADIAELEVVHRPGTDETVLTGIGLAAIEAGLVDGTLGEGFKKSVNLRSADEAAKLAGVDSEDFMIMARALSGGRKITLLAGELLARSRDREKIAAAIGNLNRLFGLESRGQVVLPARYANQRGAERLGLVSDPVPAVKTEIEAMWGSYPKCAPLSTDAMMVNMRKEEIDGFIVMGANPVMLYPDREFARETFEKLDFLVVADCFETETTEIADVVLPLASWAEYAGDYMNSEGRVQHAEQGIKPLHSSKPGYEILDLISEKLDSKLFASPGERQAEIDRLLAVRSELPWPDGFSAVVCAAPEIDAEHPTPLFVGDDPHHSGYVTEKSDSLSNFCGEAYIEMSPEMAARLEVEAGQSVRVESEVGKLVVPVRISDHLDSAVVFIPRNFASTPVTSLLMRKRRVDGVKISKVEA